MMTYNYPEAKSIVVCGDIHGAFEEMVFKLCVQYGMSDTLLIVAGDCGFGFEKPGYYDQVFNKISRRLIKANNWILMIRGNHDDPAYFQEQRIRNVRFRCIPDYSIVSACGHTILCVGGAISIDRTYRQLVDSRAHSAQTASYWEDEMPVLNTEALASINEKFKIDTVITHTAPSFCELTTKDGLAGWAQMDAALLQDCDKERSVLDGIFDSLFEAGHPLRHWLYGHFHQSWNAALYSILFTMLDIMEFKELRE